MPRRTCRANIKSNDFPLASWFTLGPRVRIRLAPAASHKNAITAADLDWTAQRSKLYNELKGWKCLLPSNGYAATLIFWAGKARLFCGTFEVALRGIVLLDRPAFVVAVTQLANTKAADGGPWQARATTHRHTLGYGLVFMPA